MVAQVSKKQTEIQQAVIFRVSDKATGTFLGYKVKSDSSEDYYEVTWNEERQIWACNCKSVKPCKHCRAASQVCQAKAEIAKQGNTSPATTEHRVSCVHGVAGARWYPEYCKNGEWFRFPLEGTTHAVSFFDEAPARAWLADRLAAIAEQAAERKMSAFKRGMDEQYASDPRRGLSLGEIETADSNMRHFYDEY